MKAKQVQQQHIAKNKIKNCLIIICEVSRRLNFFLTRIEMKTEEKQSSQRKKQTKKSLKVSTEIAVRVEVRTRRGWVWMPRLVGP